MPVTRVHELDTIELIGADEAVIQNRWGGSVAVELPAEDISGEILGLSLITRAGATGTILTPAGKLAVFKSDPSISAVATGLTTGDHAEMIGLIDVVAGDWYSDTKGAMAFFDNPIAFFTLKILYFAWFQESAAGFNSAGDDEETLELAGTMRIEDAG